MKLKEWADKTGVKYLTAYRWFKAGTLPVKAYQTDSGTIIVEDPEFSEQSAASAPSNDIMSIFLKKTVEFSKNNSSVEDFAAYVLSNFSLKLNSVTESPKYSKIKPKPEDVQKHFQQFLKPKGEKPKPNMFVTTEADTLDDLVELSDVSLDAEMDDVKVAALNNVGLTGSVPTATELQSLISNLSSAIAPFENSALFLGSSESITTYDSLGHLEGVVTRNVDVTPQSFNYIGSTHSASSAPSSNLGASVTVNSVIPQPSLTSAYVVSNNLNPSPAEIEKAHQALGKLTEDIRSTVGKAKRGRKPSKKASGK
jgi:hypothetical protein